MALVYRKYYFYLSVITWSAFNFVQCINKPTPGEFELLQLRLQTALVQAQNSIFRSEHGLAQKKVGCNTLDGSV